LSKIHILTLNNSSLLLSRACHLPCHHNTSMSDSKELSVLCATSQRLIDSDADYTITQFCHSAADVSAFEDALQQCNTEHFQAAAAAALNLSTALEQETVKETMKSTLSRLLYNVLTRNHRANYAIPVSWSMEGYSMVARIAKSILSSWCIDKNWLDDVDEESDGCTAFMQAARHGHISIVELLLSDHRVDKASIDYASNYRNNALMYAAHRGHTSILELLLSDPRVDKASIDHTGTFGETVLMRAVRQGHAPIFELLLADPRVDKSYIDHADERGWTALIYTARNGRTSMLKLLLADSRVDKASIDCTDGYGITALFYAAQCGHRYVVELLLADPRVDTTSICHTSHSGHTALGYAAISDHSAIAELLITDSRTSWDSIMRLTHDRDIMKHEEMLSAITVELTRRQMCVIYPSTNPLLWHGPVQSDAKSGDAESGGPAADDATSLREDSDGIAEPECALITSFFKSHLFDVNVLRIIKEYVTYTVRR
jgi:Ankyrin repeats (3 copies)